MPQEVHAVRLYHARVSRQYYGSQAGWGTTVHSKHTNEPQSVNQSGDTIELVCASEGCGAKFAFRLAPDKERKQSYRRTFKRRLAKFGIAMAAWALGSLLEFVAQGAMLVQVAVGVLLIAPSAITSTALLLMLLFGGRAPRYNLMHQDPSAMTAGIQHDVDLL